MGIGAVVMELLERRQWNQAELARRLGVAASTVHALVRQERPPRRPDWPAWADVLGVEAAAERRRFAIEWQLAQAPDDLRAYVCALERALCLRRLTGDGDEVACGE